MPRTIEHIVATHKHAAALRAQGKNTWPHEARIRGIIQEGQGRDLTHAELADKAIRVAKTLRASLPSSMFDIAHDDYDFDFNDAVEVLEGYTEASLNNNAKNGDDVTGEFNVCLDEIYDWADRNRVWLGA